MAKVVLARTIVCLLFVASLSSLHFSIVVVEAWTPTEGHLMEDATWTVADSPYILTGDVIVDAGVLLRIEPGVEVQFSDNSSLIVEGSLHAVGNENSKIRFTSNATNPSPGVWKNIEFMGSQQESFIMEHSLVEYAQIGVRQFGDGKVSISRSRICHSSEAGIQLLKGNVSLEMSTLDLNNVGLHGKPYGALLLDSVKISQSQIYENECGILFGEVDVTNSMVEKNDIYSNKQDGIYFDGSHTLKNLTIQENSIYDNGRSGIEVYTPLIRPISDCSFKDNDLRSNTYGLKLRVSAITVFDLAISGNVVSFNKESGIFVYSLAGQLWRGSTLLAIRNNRITSNSKIGVEIRGNWDEPSIAYVGIVSNNSITKNGCGILLSLGRVNVGYNLITNNVVGIEVRGMARAIYNDIYANTQGLIVADGASAIAEMNYWGHESGPNHPSINPSGQGDSADGNDVDLIPFLSEKIDPIIPEFPLDMMLQILLMTTVLVAIIRTRAKTRLSDK